MTDWLSATWEANWRSLRYFNAYRLILGGLFLLALFLPNDGLARLHLSPSPTLFILSGFYLLLALAGLVLSVALPRHFNLQLSTQVLIDIAAVSALSYTGGGVGSGMSVLLVVSLAAASLVGRGRLVLFYAAVATLSILGTQGYGILATHFEPGSIVQAGFISAGFFATAILARLLGQWAMANEELARRRGEALENQILISQRVVERMPGGVLIVDRQGWVQRSNPVAQSMLGLPADDAVPLAGRVTRLADALVAWRNGGADSFRFSGAGGRDLSARFEPTPSSAGEVLVFLEDQGRIQQRAQELKLAALGRLTASIAHEIRNPLAAISHAGELLREERRSAMQERLLRILNDNVARLDRIVSDVLELGRQKPALPARIALTPFCRQFVEHLQLAEGLPAEVLRLEAEGEFCLAFDTTHLDRVLWNLVVNALRHSTRGPGSVRIVLANAPEGDTVELHVIDDGPGIPEAQREQVFEPFFTTHAQGTGLGLFIARELCVANGARLELLAEPGGAHFRISGRKDPCPLAETNGAPVAR